jgi:ferritin-like metal-binding protein YciE
MIFEDHPSPEGINKLNTSKLHELFMTKLMELYRAEMGLLEELVVLQEAAYTEHTKKIIAQYQRNKGDQIDNLQQVFVLLDLPISGRNNRITDIMMEECRNLTLISKNIINDFAIGNLVMRISHYNQAAYEWLFSLATKLQLEEIKGFLRRISTMKKKSTLR